MTLESFRKDLSKTRPPLQDLGQGIRKRAKRAKFSKCLREKERKRGEKEEEEGHLGAIKSGILCCLKALKVSDDLPKFNCYAKPFKSMLV